MAKLLLLEEEVRLIKGLMAHAHFNDQEITAVFSHLDRNINHREVGAIRKSAPKYRGVGVASAAEVRALLGRYRRLQAFAKRIGVSPSSDNELRVEKAIELMRAAVTIYNNPALSFRTEMFIVNAVIAWTYVLHAYYFARDIPPIYEDKAPAEDDALRYWDLAACLKRGDVPLSKGEQNNLKYLLLLRHEVEHRLARDIDEPVQSKAQQCVINFSGFCEKHFGSEYSLTHDLGFAIQFARLTAGAANALKGSAPVPPVVERVNKLMEADMSEADYNDPAYAFRVYVVPKTTNNQKDADQAVTYAPAGSNIEMAIKYVERPKYRAHQIVTMLKAAGHKRFGPQRFIEFWKKHRLKDPARGLAVEVGGQWFWYREVVDVVARELEAQKAKDQQTGDQAA